ncbi:DNA repair protein RecO [Beduinella massiliensis]|uniref:DNA repair protein RecO n=1 Tax=Beduinella massiliensis TaxID=1852363 RepID=UPI000C8613C2
MGNFTIHAVVVRHADYRENDRMLTLFSPVLGRVEALCRGCRRQKSPLLAASELLCAGEYVLYQKNDRCTVVSCAVQDSFYPLRGDYERLTHGLYITELCDAAIQPGQEAERLFLLLLRSLAHLAYGKAPADRLTSIFLCGYASLLGYRPRLGSCLRCGVPLPEPGKEAYFDHGAGGVLCVSCAQGRPVMETGAAQRISRETLIFLQGTMKLGLAMLDSEIAMPEKTLPLLRRYVETRVEKTIRSAKLIT